MRFMIQVRATVTSERGEPPGPELKPLFEEMGAFHEEMARAGVLLDGAGLRPSRQGWRQRYHPDGRREVVDGPFAKTKELIAGYTLIQVRSAEEAQAWGGALPQPLPGPVLRDRGAPALRGGRLRAGRRHGAVGLSQRTHEHLDLLRAGLAGRRARVASLRIDAP